MAQSWVCFRVFEEVDLADHICSSKSNGSISMARLSHTIFYLLAIGACCVITLIPEVVTNVGIDFVAGSTTFLLWDFKVLL
jgi:hypothetical protein